MAVTLEVEQELLKTQGEGFSSSIKLLVQNVKEMQIGAILSMYSENVNDINQQTENFYQSRRNNVRITGIPENKNVGQTWDDTENIAKQSITDKLNIYEDFEMERCHRVNIRKRRNNNMSGQPEKPRPIVAKVLKWN